MLWKLFAEQVSQLGTEEFFRRFPHPFLISSLAPLDINLDPAITPQQTILPSRLNDSTRLNLLSQPSLLDNLYIIPLAKTKIKIGRETGCDLIFTSSEISRQHLVISFLQCTPSVWTITDCCSRNGTLVNGEKIKGALPQALSDQDFIELGCGASLIFRSPVGIWKLLKNASLLEESSCG